MSRRLFALVTALYPRAWRERYAEELSDLCEEFVDAGETTRLHLALTILFAAAVERFRSLRSSRHRVLLASSTVLIVVLAAVTFATNGFGLLVSALPTKGPVPNDAIVNGQTDISKVPDFVAAVGKDGKIVGYVPKADLFPAPTRGAHLGPQTPFEVQPVYAGDLRTLVGHFYPGIGFVPLGVSPSTQSCVPESTVANGQSQAIPCPGVAQTIPNVVGMYTPTGVAKLSGMGLSVQIVAVLSSSVTPGHIVSILPIAGTTVAARSVVTVDISVNVS
jgi:hypothetical protein